MSQTKQTGLPFSLFREQAENDFTQFLRSFDNHKLNKTYVTFPHYLERFCIRLINFGKLGVNIVKIDSVEKSEGKANIIIITPAERTNVEMILEKFKNVPNYTKMLLLIPRMTALVKNVLEVSGFKTIERGVISDTSSEIYLNEFHADFLPVDIDFFLLPCYKSFFQINAENDFNDLYASARALVKIQSVFGAIPNVLTVGKSAERVRSLMKSMMSQTGTSSSSQTSQIDSLIIFDRAVDVVTPLCSQSTFEGLADEIFGVNFGITFFDESGKSENSVLAFTENISIVAEMRGENIDHVSPKLDDRIKEYKKYFDRDKNDMLHVSNEEFKKRFIYMKQLNDEKQFFVTLQNLAEKLIHKAQNTPLYIPSRDAEFDLLVNKISVYPLAEHFIQLVNNWKEAIRLLTLESALGVKVKYDNFIQEMIDQYGEKAIQTIKTLSRLNLVLETNKPQKKFDANKLQMKFENNKLRKKWSKINSALNLVNSDDNISCMCDRVVPLIVRLAEKSAKGDWPGNWGEHFTSAEIPLNVDGQPLSPTQGKVRRQLIFFVGGVTLSEVAYIRNLGKRIFDGRIEYIVGATDQINSSNFTNQLCPGLFDE